MAFVVEDGSGKTNANSYSEVAEADAYHAERGNALWATYTEPQKEQRLVKATDYMDKRFGERWVGERGSDAQALDWPRICGAIYLPDEIPTKLKYAQFEYALRITTSAPELAPDLKLNDAGVAMVTTSMKAGPVEQKFMSASGSSAPATVYLVRPYPGADMYLRNLVVTAQRVIH